MFDFYEKRKLRHIVHSKPVLVVLAIIAVLLGNSVWGLYGKVQETHEKRTQRAQALDELREREAVLDGEIEGLSTDRGLEAEIRRKYDVAREGEQVIVIVDPQVQEDESRQQEESIWDKIMNFIGL